VFLPRHHLHPEDAGAAWLVDLRHLRQAGDVAANQIVREVYEECGSAPTAGCAHNTA